MIAIVTAVYKADPLYLSRQIDSYSQQTFKDFLIIFVNADQSSHKIIQELCSPYSFDYTIITPALKLGPREAFGFGIQEAINTRNIQYISLSDQDDVWLPHKLSTLLRIAKQSGVSLVHSNASIIDEQGNIIQARKWHNKNENDHTKLEYLQYTNYVIGMTCLFPVKTAKIAVPFLENDSLEPLHDWLLAIAAGMIGEIRYVDLGLVLYRQHSNNVVGYEITSPITNLFTLAEQVKTKWRWALKTQPLVQLVFSIYTQRCIESNIALVNNPPYSNSKKGRLLFLAWYFFRTRRLGGLFAVIVRGFGVQRSSL